MATVLHADRDVAVVAEHRTPRASRASLLPGTGYGRLAPGPVNALDGKLFASDWLSEQTTSVKGKLIDAWYSGKAHEDGGNIQALSAPDGFPLWVSAVEPGSTHDLTAARAHVLAALYWRPPSWIWRLWPMSAMRGPGSAAAAASLPVALEDEFTFGLEPILTGLGSIHRG